jgi:hypothetical protein
MTTAANIAIALVALLHLYFLVLEMFLWDKPFGRRTFKLTPEFAAASKGLAAKKINLVALSAVTAGNRRYGMVFWVKPKDVGRTARLLHAS